MNGLKIFLDDERKAPEGWTRTRSVDETIAMLELPGVEEVSLDHDLGDDESGTGYDVILWIEEAVATKGYTPPTISIHTANPSARVKMELAVASIVKMCQRG